MRRSLGRREVIAFLHGFSLELDVTHARALNLVEVRWGVWVGEGCRRRRLAVRVDVLGLPVAACRCGLRGSRNDVGRGGRNLVPHVAAGGVLVLLRLRLLLMVGDVRVVVTTLLRQVTEGSRHYGAGAARGFAQEGRHGKEKYISISPLVANRRLLPLGVRDGGRDRRQDRWRGERKCGHRSLLEETGGEREREMKPYMYCRAVECQLVRASFMPRHPFQPRLYLHLSSFDRAHAHKKRRLGFGFITLFVLLISSSTGIVHISTWVFSKREERNRGGGR